MRQSAKRLYICVDNAGYEASLDRGKVYVGTADAKAAARGQLRIADESGDSYLYDSARFVGVRLPTAARRAVLHSLTGRSLSAT